MSRHPRAARGRAGMTLIELAVGMVVTGLVMAMGYGAFAGIVDRRAAVRAATIEVERAAALRETVHGWLAAGRVLVQQGGAPRAGSGVGAGEAVADEIIVSTYAPSPAAAPTVLLRLYVDDDDDTPEAGLTVQYQENVEDSLRTRELEPRVRGLRVEYLDRRTGRWLPAAEVATIQPVALRLTLLGADEALGTAADSLPALLRLPFVQVMGGGVQAQGAGR
jgi:prepilin-type N-terminal cleavage/methylation domain-containing protein